MADRERKEVAEEKVKNLLLLLGIAGAGLYLASHLEARSRKKLTR